VKLSESRISWTLIKVVSTSAQLGHAILEQWKGRDQRHFKNLSSTR